VLPPADAVHLWALDLTRSPGEVGGLLPSEDLRRAEQAGPRWVVARAGMRGVLARYLDEDPAALRFDERGKPALDPPSPLRFNLSHSGDVALVAVATEREVGVDVEEVKRRRDAAALARRTMVAAERAAIDEADDQLLAFHRHWVAKEAFAKATGRGIASPRSFEVQLDAPGGPRIAQVGGDEDEARRWSLHMLDVAEPYVAALVTEGEARVAAPAVFLPWNAGLCDDCVHQRIVRNTRGSTFSLCERSRDEPERFPRYPRLPVTACTGYEPRTSGPRPGPPR
jgi:4'-phosphopantetheinyl transferase